MSMMAAGIASAAMSTAANVIASDLASDVNSKAIRAMKESLNKRESIIQNWYNNQANQDPLSRPSSVRAITQLKDIGRQQAQAATGRNVVMGGSNADVAAQKEANAKMMGEAMSGIAASAEQRKDAVNDQYMQAQMGIDQQRAEQQQQQYKQQADAIMAAAKGVSDASSSAFKAYASANSPANKQ